MNALIETPNLGPVTISSIAIKRHSKRIEGEDLAKAEEELIRIVQSKEIEQLEIPSSIESRVSLSGGNPSANEFWVHMSSSMVFHVLPKDGYKIIFLGIKQDMEGFVSEKNELGIKVEIVKGEIT